MIGPENQYLGLIGHGTTGTDGIEPGIHLRWQFRSESGFPLGGFSLFRRPVSARPRPICVNFQRFRAGIREDDIVCGPRTHRLKISSIHPQIEFMTESLQEDFYRSLDREQFPWLDVGSAKSKKQVQLLRLDQASLVIEFPVLVHEVTLLVVLRLGGSISVSALFEGSVVDSAHFTSSLVPQLQIIVLRAPAIDKLRVSGSIVGIQRICFDPLEPCSDMDGWEPVDKICLPIHYPGKPDGCAGRKGPECDELEIFDRLPEEHCEQQSYKEAVPDLVSSLRLLIDDQSRFPQADRMIRSPVEIDDCPVPGEAVPSLEMPIIDTLNLAAIDPVIARVLGLYYVDHPQPRGNAFDYKIMASWPEGTVWSLPQSLNFDDSRDHERQYLNYFPAGPLVFKAAVRPTVVPYPNLQLGTARALAFFETDDFDWNLPRLTDSLGPGNDNNVIIYFPEPVGEVQVFIGQETADASLEAFNGDISVSDAIRSTQREDILAVHGKNKDDLISHVVLKGRRFWIYQISWGSERIAHGEYCAIAYGLAERDADRPLKPEGVEAYPLPGIVRKEADCEPPLEGQTVDARLGAGVTWLIPESGDDLQPNAPVAYDVYRVDDIGSDTHLTTERMVIVAPPDDDVDLPPYQPPPGWPEAAPPHYIDEALEPGTYRYYVVGQSIFGARSEQSDLSSNVTPQPPPPAAPTMQMAYYIEESDPFLNAVDRAAISGTDTEAIRLRWQWPEGAARSSPDARSFKAYYSPGRPNMLEGTIGELEVDSPSDHRLRVTATLSGNNSIPSNLLAGRQLVQNGRQFCIIASSLGQAQNGIVTTNLRLRLPLEPSQSRPVPGSYSIQLNAVIPVEIWSLTRDGDFLIAEIRTRALGGEPSGGLQNGELRLLDARVRIAAITDGSFQYTGSRFEARIEMPNRNMREQLLRLNQTPLFTSLDLPDPNTAYFRDYTDPASWPNEVGTPIPRTGAGEFDLLIRKKAANENPSFEQIGPRSYVLVPDSWPAGLDVSSATLRREMAFGVSCLGPNGTESAVSTPVVLTRYHRGDIGDANQLATLDQLEPDPEYVDNNTIFASNPDFAGESAVAFSWPGPANWTYEVYRALDASLFFFDAKMRGQVPAVGLGGRFADNAERDAFLANFPQALHTDIRQLVIEPPELDQAAQDAIEDHSDTNVLLQALASLPLNDQAFTRIELDDGHLNCDEAGSGRCHFEDDSLEGRARGRYFYRVRAYNEIAGVSELGLSSQPVHVRGISLPAAPVITRIQGGDRQITICWAATRNPIIKGYLVYRTDDAVKANDWRQMDPIKKKDTDEYSRKVPDPLPDPLPTEYDYTDQAIEPRKRYFYGVVAVSEHDNRQKQRSKMSEIKVGQGFDLTPPDPPAITTLEWVRVGDAGKVYPYDDPIPPDQTRHAAVRIVWSASEPNLESLVQFRYGQQRDFLNASQWLPQGQYEFIHRNEFVFWKQEYRIKVQNRFGNTNVVYISAQLDEALHGG